jgi:tetratricopeptide (TPR) repeat protein
VLGALLLAGVAHAEGFGDIFRAGNDAFFQGNHAKAEAQYERLVSAGVQDADVYFNLGLAHARQGELGSAIWCFEKSARLAPGDADPVNAIATARAALGKRRAERQGEATVEARPPLAEALVQAYREDTLALWLALLDVLCFGLLIAWRFAGTDTLRTGLAIGAAIGLLGACVAGAALLVKRGGFSEGQAAIILHEAAELREGPDPRARTRATAHEGARARVLRRDGAFLRVQLDSTGSAAERSDGWMLAKDVGTLD